MAYLWATIAIVLIGVGAVLIVRAIHSIAVRADRQMEYLNDLADRVRRLEKQRADHDEEHRLADEVVLNQRFRRDGPLTPRVNH